MHPVKAHYLEEAFQLTDYSVEQGLRYSESDQGRSSGRVKDDPPVLTPEIVEQLCLEQELGWASGAFTVRTTSDQEFSQHLTHIYECVCLGSQTLSKQ